MAEQLLKRPQIRSPRQQMSCDAVTERVRRQRVGQPKPLPCSSNRAANQVGVERPSSHTDEQGRRSLQTEGTLPDIVVERLLDRWQYRNDAGFGALAGNSQCRSDRQNFARQRHCLGNTEARSIEKQENREIARSNPGLESGICSVPRELDCLIGRCRPRERARPFWSTRSRQLRLLTFALGDISEKGPDPREFAGSRRSAKAVAAPLGKKCTQIRGFDFHQCYGIDPLTPILTEKLNEAVCSRDIGTHRVSRASPVMLEI